MFLLKKLITSLLVPPGLFVTLLLVSVIFARKRLRIFVCIIVLLLYGASIEPTKNVLLIPLEDTYRNPGMADIKACEAYVVLGSSSYGDAPDLHGKGILDGDALHRVTDAYRLFLLHRKPIIYSGGTLYSKDPEAEIARRFLLSLGVPDAYIIAESKSRDTYENALFTSEICRSRKIEKILLITSAFHMRRSVMLFRKHFAHIVPFPTDYKTSRKGYTVFGFLPEASNPAGVAIALKEYLGIMYYKITL
jgi:uncharacterized SAM-binding protein YcdF (DUF218 family)